MHTHHTDNPIARALALYEDQSLGIRAFTRARDLLAPLQAIEDRVPEEGRVLDVGCGHGLFTALMAVASPARSILGVDPSEGKIQIAQGLTAKLPNVRFFQGTIQEVDEGPFDAITILDVLYLLPLEEKVRILRRCHELLAPGGRLVLKTNDTHPAWKYQWARLQEVAMTRVGLTLNHGSLHFFSCGQHLGLLKQVGFDRVDVVHLPFLLPYPHTLFTCFR